MLQKGNHARLDVDVIFTVAAHAHLFMAMFVTDYESLETIYKLDGDRSVKLRFWGRPDQLPHLKESMAVAGDLLNYLVKYVRQPFTLPKIDLITSPIQLHFEAMENWGLILFRYNQMTYINFIINLIKFNFK
jgi:aminopeptidase N